MFSDPSNSEGLWVSASLCCVLREPTRYMCCLPPSSTSATGKSRQAGKWVTEWVAGSSQYFTADAWDGHW
jgi:hypothetical protein